MNNSKQVKPVDILLVEDNPGDVQLAKIALEESTLLNNLYHAEDGEQALNFLYKREPFTDAPRPDLVILDLNLPKKDGREVLAIVKNDDHLKRIPIVILTTSTAESDILQTYDLHANCYISKPIDLDQFIKVVKSIEDFWMSIVLLPKGD